MNSDSENKASFKDVNLTGTTIAGDVNMGGSTYRWHPERRRIESGRRSVGATQRPKKDEFPKRISEQRGDREKSVAWAEPVLMRRPERCWVENPRQSFGAIHRPGQDKFPGTLTLAGTKVAGQVSLIGTTFDGTLNSLPHAGQW